MTSIGTKEAASPGRQVCASPVGFGTFIEGEEIIYALHRENLVASAKE